jgi:protein-tyrosine phosphatase
MRSLRCSSLRPDLGHLDRRISRRGFPAVPLARRLDWPDCRNARDLGGIPRRGGVTRSRVLIRSDHLGQLNELGMEALRAYGVTTVLDLRSEGEILKRPGPFPAGGTTAYINRVLIDDQNMNNIGDSQDMFQRYLFIVNTRPEAFRGVFEAIAEAEGTVLFHCFAGKDRTGLVAAMLLSLAGVADGDIAADYGETDVQLAAQYELWIAEAPPEKQAAFRAELMCPPERILGILDHIDRRWGGVASYLEDAGMAPDAIDRVARRL